MFDDVNSRVPVLPTLDDPNPVQRADALRLIRAPTPEFIENALTDRDPSVRAAALWRLNVHLSEAQIERALLDPTPAVRVRACLRPEWLSLTQIQRALADDSPLVRANRT